MFFDCMKMYLEIIFIELLNKGNFSNNKNQNKHYYELKFKIKKYYLVHKLSLSFSD